MEDQKISMIIWQHHGPHKIEDSNYTKIIEIYNHGYFGNIASSLKLGNHKTILSVKRSILLYACA